MRARAASVDLVQAQFEQEAVMLGHPPTQGRLQLVGRGVDAPMGQRYQGLGHGVAGNQGLDDPSTAEACWRPSENVVYRPSAGVVSAAFRSLSRR